MSTIDESAIKTQQAMSRGFGLGWALKRAVIGIAILAVMFGGGAWLLYTTIEPDRADASETAISLPVTPSVLSRQ